MPVVHKARLQSRHTTAHHQVILFLRQRGLTPEEVKYAMEHEFTRSAQDHNLVDDMATKKHKLLWSAVMFTRCEPGTDAARQSPRIREQQLKQALETRLPALLSLQQHTIQDLDTDEDEDVRNKVAALENGHGFLSQTIGKHAISKRALGRRGLPLVMHAAQAAASSRCHDDVHQYVGKRLKLEEKTEMIRRIARRRDGPSGGDSMIGENW